MSDVTPAEENACNIMPEYATGSLASESCLGNAVASAQKSSETKSNHGGSRPGSGRPRMSPENPWCAEGVSKATYYRRLDSKPKPITIYASNDPQWCVVAFWGQAEVSGTTELTRIGYETYMPLVAIRRRDAVIASMWHTVYVPLFPGYGFTQLTPTQSREPILETRGIRAVLLRPDGRPAAVPDAYIDSLRVNDAARLKLPKKHGPVLAVGTLVRIEDGAFTSFPATVLECDGVKTRVEAHIFGRSTPVWLDRVAVVVV